MASTGPLEISPAWASTSSTSPLIGGLDFRLCQAGTGKLDLAIKQLEIGIRVGELFVFELRAAWRELLARSRTT